MAFRKVDPGPAPELAPFHQFNAIGDKFGGVFVSYAEGVNNFDKKEHRYTFKTKEGPKVIAANYDLHRRLQYAKLQPGWRVLIAYTHNVPNTDPNKSAMKGFEVQVDDSPPTAAVAAPPPPPASTSGDDFPW